MFEIDNDDYGIEGDILSVISMRQMAERRKAESMLFVGLSKTTTLCNIARRSLMEGLTVREKFNKRWKLLSGNFFGMEPSLAMTLSTTGSCPYS